MLQDLKNCGLLPLLFFNPNTKIRNKLDKKRTPSRLKSITNWERQTSIHHCSTLQYSRTESPGHHLSYSCSLRIFWKYRTSRLVHKFMLWPIIYFPERSFKFSTRYPYKIPTRNLWTTSYSWRFWRPIYFLWRNFNTGRGTRVWLCLSPKTPRFNSSYGVWTILLNTSITYLHLGRLKEFQKTE